MPSSNDAAIGHALEVHERELHAHQQGAARQKEAADWQEMHAELEVRLGNMAKARVMQERADRARQREHDARERADEAERLLIAARSFAKQTATAAP